MKVVTKAQASSVLLDSLFRPGRTLVTGKFDNGKYRVDQSFIGREVKDLPGVHAVYPVHKRDGDGPYVQLMCISEPHTTRVTAEEGAPS
jgi:IMP cyclohydrolase